MVHNTVSEAVVLAVVNEIVVNDVSLAADQIDHHRDTTDRNQLDAIIEEVLRNRSSDRSSFRQSRRKLLELVARVANRN